VIRVALRGLFGRKLRTALTAFAIVLGVAMISGTYVLTDTIDRAFHSIFSDTYANTDVVVSGKQAFTTDFSTPPPFDQSLLSRISSLGDVASAAGSIQDSAQLTDKQGKAINANGAPTFGDGVDFSQPQFNPLRLNSGHWPSGPTEVAIDAGTADKENYRVGDPIGIVAKGPERKFTITGIAQYGSVKSLGTATFAVFDLRTAQKLFHKEGKLDFIFVAGDRGASPTHLANEIKPLLPPHTQVRTGNEQTKEDLKDVEFTKFIRYFLLAFGGIALFVGAFVIFNTLSITIAQRTRELATLRTVGASRRQVLRSVLVEALVIGVLASVIGLFLGLALAKGLDAVFKALSFDLPTTTTVFSTRTIIVSLLVGVIVTVAAGLMPAIRATRVPPIAAVREGFVLPRGRIARFAPAIAIGTTLLGLALLLIGMFKNNVETVQRLLSLGLGCLILFFGVALMSSRFVKPLARVLGWPGTRIGGAPGRLARENAQRNPGRTASTSAALMIGLALIAFVAVLAAGLRTSVAKAIDDQVTADYVVTSKDNFTPFQPAADDTLASLNVETVPVRGDTGKIFGSKQNVTGVDPRSIGRVYAFDWTDGSDATLSSFGPNDALVEKDYAEDHDLRVGSRLAVLTPAGKRATVTVRGLYDAPPFWEMLGKVTIAQTTFDRIFENPRNLYTFIRAIGGPTPELQAQLEQALTDFPSVKVEDKEGFREAQESGISQLLNLLYVLLALSVLISFFGIVNTLVLTVFERTREIGMLRAVGMTRRQTRRMIRYESVVTALIGATLGIVLGIFLALLVTKALASEGLSFALPVGSLIAFVVASIVVGMLAAILPARRAARLNVLEALQYE
jgi:putative ABC transport system permease protein